MEEQLISFETAKLAKEKGFILNEVNRPILQIYHLSGKLEYDSDGFEANHKEAIYAPTQSLLQKWLREVHGIYVSVTSYDLKFIQQFNYKFQHNLMVIDSNRLGDASIYIQNTNFEIYEEALEHGLFEALKLVP